MSHYFLTIFLFSLLNIISGCDQTPNAPNEYIPSEDDTQLLSSDNNIQNLKSTINVEGMRHVVLSKDTTFEAQINYAHTIYEICNEFDLKGQNIKLPYDCILYFNGGILYDGTIIGNNTCIRADIRKIFNTDLYIQGVWNVDIAYPEWYGAKGDGKTDDRMAIQKTIDAFSYTLLSPKTYFINSVNNNDEKYGLVLTRGKKLAGTRIQCTTFAEDIDNITIKVNEKLDIVSVVRLTTLCELDHIGIIGNKVNANSSCVSSEQASRMILNNVSVAKSNVGFDMKSYLTRYESCYASYCQIGFALNGTGVKNTTNVLEACQAIDCKRYGYYFNMITYSTLISCAADGCGTSDLSSLGYAYYLDRCDCMSFVSCGSEQCLKPIFCQKSKNIAFTNCNYLVDKHHLTLPKDYKLNDIINIRHSEHIKVENCIVNYSLVKKNIEPDARLIHLYGSATDNVILTYVPDVEDAVKRENIGASGFIDISKNLRYSYSENYPEKGNSRERPRFKNGNQMKGYQFFDTSLGKPIWWNGANWVDATGNRVR